MSRWISLVLCLSILAPVGLQAQERSALEARRQNLLKRIDETRSLITTARKRQQTTLADIQTLKAEISLRREVVKNLNQEVNLVEQTMREKEKTLTRLKASSKQLLSRHGEQLRQAYIGKRMEHPLAFLISADNLNEAFARWRYLNAVRTMRQRTYDRIHAHQDSIASELASLEALRSTKGKLLDDVQQQESSLASNVSASERMLGELKSRENELQAELAKQKKESAELAAEIERIINSEIAKAEAPAALPNAPALKALAAEFSSNRGQLPWPVIRGTVTGKFGEQPHPVLKSITIANNGIDITAPRGQAVQAIFDGTVVGRKSIPGYDNMVIIQHGTYYSVYSRLASVNVDLGDKVETGTRIGRLSSSGEDTARLHLEIWQGKVQQDPESWISR
jgi:septal ring factor EnvC (AmiA/AmiB activator)